MNLKNPSAATNSMFTPCSYQVKLLEFALKQNTIACVNSESGKQFLSIMLIREMIIKSNNEDNCFGGQNLAVLLLTNETAVKCQGELLQNHLNLSVKYCLKEESYNFSVHDWKQIFTSNQVLTVSPELLCTTLYTDRTLAKHISLLIFDECHFVSAMEHPYQKIMKILDEMHLSPNILALTTSLLREDVTADDLKKDIQQMEYLLHSTAQTATDLVALDHNSLTNPTENIILSADKHKDVDDINLINEIEKLLKYALNWLSSSQIHSNIHFETIDWEVETLSNNLNENVDNDMTKTNDVSDHFIETGDGYYKNNFISSQNHLSEDEDVCNVPKLLLQEVLIVLDVLGPWCVYKMAELISKQLHKILLGIDRRLKQVILENNDEEPTTGTVMWQKMLLQYVNTKLQMIYSKCHQYMGHHKSIDRKFISPKVHRLLQVLKEYKPVKTSETQQNCKYSNRNESDYVSWWQDSDADDEEEEIDVMQEEKTANSSENTLSPFTNTLCGVVFVQEKYVAMMLHQLLREISKEDKDFKHVISSHLESTLIDNLQAGLYSASVDKNNQEEVLRKFRSHETNLIITSSSLEDCAHIPKCNLVVRFDAPRSYRAYVQSKSRALASTSAFVMLVRESEKLEFMEKLQEYKRIEQVLLRPVSQDIESSSFDEDVDDDYSDEILPYVTSGKAVASMDNAIHIINRYCSRLPSDPFTHLTPRCEVFEEPGGYYDDESIYRCTLLLPINSYLRQPIEGQPMPSVIIAQKAVAVEACRMLHQCGELDDNLMPIGKETVKYVEELDPWKPEHTTVLGRPGSTKRRQTYTKDVPRVLTKCLPRPGIPLFLYEIEMRMKNPLTDELNVRRRKIYYPERIPKSFGILTTKLIPQIPGTPIFTRSGEETARLRLCKSFLVLNEQHIRLIKSFHRYIFSDTLRVDRVPLFFKPEAAENQLLIVMLHKVSSIHDDLVDIDWDFMVQTDLKQRTAEKIKKDPWYSHRMNEKNKEFKYRRKDYEDAVVTRNYGNCDQLNRYYVAEIKDNLNPSSPFPSLDYISYKHYYEVKYNVNIKCNNQPLLDVDHTPSRLNLLTPRHLSRKGKSPSSRDKRSKPKNPVIFVPELCDAHPIPASLWRKVVCLPSILYRISQLLIGEELRRDIAIKSGIVSESPPLGFNWPDVDFSSAYVNPESSSSTLLSPTLQRIDDLNDQAKLNDPLGSIKITEGQIECDNFNQDTSDVENSVSKTGPSFSRETVLPSLKSNNDSAVNSDISDKNRPTFSNALNGNINLSASRNHSEVNRLDETLSNSSDENSDCIYFSDDYKRCFISDIDERRDFDKRRKKMKRKRKIESSKNYSSMTFVTTTVIENHPDPSQVASSKIGPGPEVLLQALTLSNASDGYNLERMEMLGDSFLKHAVTLYLYCTYPDAHEGKLSYMRSKKVSNYNLYRIGRNFGIAGKMTAHIFDPIVNWLPACYTVASPDNDDDNWDGLSDDEVEIGVWTGVPNGKKASSGAAFTNLNRTNVATSASNEPQNFAEEEEEMYDEEEIRMIDGMLGGCLHRLGRSTRGMGLEKKGSNGMLGIDFARVLSGHASMHFTDKAALRQSAALNRTADDFVIDTWTPLDSSGKPLSNNDPLLLELHSQHSLSDKSIADSVEALLGAYLTACGHRAAQLLLCHLGLTVLPQKNTSPSSFSPTVDCYGYLVAPPNNFTYFCRSKFKIKQLLYCLGDFEHKINYSFKNKSYLLQAFTHASYYYNTATDCYQRLEFLGDAVLDFLITRHLCADDRQHSPGALTDLRCALVNNTIFASLAVRYDFHKFFKSISPELQKVIEDFVSYQQRQEEAQGMDAQLMKHYGDNTIPTEEFDQSFMDADEEEDETEDVEVPKALGDIFESVAGAIFMDSGMNLDAVWDVYSVMMLPLIEKFSSCVPRSPVRELLEMEPETAKFSCAEKRFDGKIRVTVEIIGKGRFKGVGRSYRIAKSAAARRALRFLKRNYS